MPKLNKKTTTVIFGYLPPIEYNLLQHDAKNDEAAHQLINDFFLFMDKQRVAPGKVTLHSTPIFFGLKRYFNFIVE